MYQKGLPDMLAAAVGMIELDMEDIDARSEACTIPADLAFGGQQLIVGDYSHLLAIARIDCHLASIVGLVHPVANQVVACGGIVFRLTDRRTLLDL